MARQRFINRDWHGMQEDHAQRLEVYNAAIDQIFRKITDVLGERLHAREVWIGIKAVYSGLITDRDDREIAETFLNSVTRSVFTTIGVDNDIEFVHTDIENPPAEISSEVYREFAAARSTAEVIEDILKWQAFPLTTAARQRDARLAGEIVDERLRASGIDARFECVQMVKSVFFRGELAYIIGRMFVAGRLMPFVLCMRNGDEGVYLDAVLTEENDVSLLFSFARSYFHVEVERPYELVQFIGSIIPRKRAAEIYISIGYNKHGKTELYRNALRHLAESTDKYVLARGQRGMVMICFTLPSYGVVFKIIKDEFEYPKTCTREQVIGRYHLVFRHDRAGRLIDAQEYRYLELERPRFTDELVEELLRVAGETVSVRGDKVVFKLCYAERRVTPLNVYLQEADDAAARSAVIDYGHAIKDLARTNIFPGDLMLKNFGVTRHGRLVFYDYDEICLLTDCNIREMPDEDDYDSELSSEPWYGVGQNDVFPQEFRYFLGLPEPLFDVFLEHHSDLLEVNFWKDVQCRLRAGELFHVAPYPPERRLDHARGCVEMPPMRS